MKHHNLLEKKIHLLKLILISFRLLSFWVPASAQVGYLCESVFQTNPITVYDLTSGPEIKMMTFNIENFRST